MTPRSFLLDDRLWRYVVDHTEPFDDVLAEVTARTEALGGVSSMQIGPDHAALLTMLTRFGEVRNAVEVGTFTGTSSLCIARGLAPGGRLLCCDVSDEWTEIAHEAWVAAGVDDRVDLAVGPALDTLRALPRTDEIDLAFVDADKTGYLDYYEELVPRLRPGGLIVADNTLWGGQVPDPDASGDDIAALRAYNDRAHNDDRVTSVVLALADGLTVSQKR